MPKYKVILTEKIFIEKEIEADNPSEAQKKIEKKLYNSTILTDKGKKQRCYKIKSPACEHCLIVDYIIENKYT